MSSISRKVNTRKTQQKGKAFINKNTHFGSKTRRNTEEEEKKLLENSDHSNSKNNLRNSLPSSKVPVLLKSTLGNHPQRNFDRVSENNRKKENPWNRTSIHLNSKDTPLKDNALEGHCASKHFQDMQSNSLSYSNIPQGVLHSRSMKTPPLKDEKNRKCQTGEIHSKKTLPVKLSLNKMSYSDINISSYSTAKREKVRFSDFLESKSKTNLKTDKNVSDRKKSGCKYDENSKKFLKKCTGMSADKVNHSEQASNIFCNNQDHQIKCESDESLETMSICSNSCNFKHVNEAESSVFKQNLVNLFEERNKESKATYSGTSKIDNRNGEHEVNECSVKMDSLMSDASEVKKDCTKKLMECTSNSQSGAKSQSQDNCQKLPFNRKESIENEINDKLKVLTAKFLKEIKESKRNNTKFSKFQGNFKRSYFNNLYTPESQPSIGDIIFDRCEIDDKVHLGEKDVSFKKSNEDVTLNQFSMQCEEIPREDSQCSKSSSDAFDDNNSSIKNRKESPDISPGNSRIPRLIYPTKRLLSPRISPVLDNNIEQYFNKTDIELPPHKRKNLEKEADVMTEILNEKLMKNYNLNIIENIRLDSLLKKKENEYSKFTEEKVNFDGENCEPNRKENGEGSPKTHVSNFSTSEKFSNLNEKSCSSSCEKQKQNKTIYSRTSPIFTDHDFYENSDTTCQKLGTSALDGKEENGKQFKCDNLLMQSKAKDELLSHANETHLEKIHHLKWKQMTMKEPARKETNGINVLYSKKILFILSVLVCFGLVIKLTYL